MRNPWIFPSHLCPGSGQRTQSTFSGCEALRPTVASLLDKINSSVALLVEAGESLPGKSPIERPFHSNLKQVRNDLVLLEKQYAGKNPALLKTLRGLGASTAALSASRSAIGITDSSVSARLRELREGTALLERSIGFAGLSAKKPLSAAGQACQGPPIPDPRCFKKTFPPHGQS